MNCRRVNLLLGVYRQLDRAERRMVDTHLRDCEACRQVWRDERRLRAVIDQLDTTTLVPPGVRAEVDEYLNIRLEVS